MRTDVGATLLQNAPRPACTPPAYLVVDEVVQGDARTQERRQVDDEHLVAGCCAHGRREVVGVEVGQQVENVLQAGATG